MNETQAISQVPEAEAQHPIERVLALIADEIGGTWGAQSVLARRMDVSDQYVAKMVKSRHVPQTQYQALSDAVSGAVTVEEIFAGCIKRSK